MNDAHCQHPELPLPVQRRKAESDLEHAELQVRMARMSLNSALKMRDEKRANLEHILEEIENKRKIR